MVTGQWRRLRNRKFVTPQKRAIGENSRTFEKSAGMAHAAGVREI